MEDGNGNKTLEAVFGGSSETVTTMISGVNIDNAPVPAAAQKSPSLLLLVLPSLTLRSRMLEVFQVEEGVKLKSTKPKT